MLKDKSTFVIYLVSLLFIIFFGIWMIYLVTVSPMAEEKKNYGKCGPGECATSLLTGFKRCNNSFGVTENNNSFGVTGNNNSFGVTGNNNSYVLYDPEFEVCNKSDSCNNLFTPYSVMADGSTSIYGVCDQDGCPCVKVPQCANYVLTLFNTTSYDKNVLGKNVDVTNLYISQISSNEIGMPLTFESIGTNFCSIPSTFLPFSACNFINKEIPDYNDITFCLNTSCPNPNYTSTPTKTENCKNGMLSILSNNPDLINKSNLANQEFACVIGNDCPCSKIPVFNTSIGRLQCINI